MSVVGPPATGASTIWFSAVSYATVEALTNCGASAPASSVHTFFALAGSWMSRTTMVGSPTTVPMTRLSPAGTAPGQWTRDAGPGLPVGMAEVLAVGVAPADEVAGVAMGLCAAVGVPPPPQATATKSDRTATPNTRTA